MIDIEVIAPNGSRWPDSALIDTGADTSAFPLHWLKRLGIRKKDCDKCEFETAGGRDTQWRYPEPLPTRIAGQEIPLEVCFVDAPLVLLGRADFLMHFEVAFDQRAQRMRLRAY